jgi:hypothetical protein
MNPIILQSDFTLSDTDMLSEAVVLEPRVVTFLTLLANGEEQKQINLIMGVSGRMTRKFSEVSRKALGAETLIHAVALAVARGIVVVKVEG